jgi:hypothetical protein
MTNPSATRQAILSRIRGSRAPTNPVQINAMQTRLNMHS